MTYRISLYVVALVINEFNLILNRLFPQKEMDCQMESTKKTYYFMVKAKRYTTSGVSKQTRYVEIKIDTDKYTRRDAEHFASREFVHLDDNWLIEITSMTQEHYLYNKQIADAEFEEIRPSTETAKTNS